MPTDTFTIAANEDDGHCRRAGNTTWVNIPTSAFSDNPYGSNLATTQKHFVAATPVGTIACAFFRWDTSSIPDDATITGAVFKVHVLDHDDPSNEQFAFDFYDFGGTPSTSADFEATSAADAIAAFDVDTLTKGAVNNLTLTGLTGISLSGFTGLRAAPATSSEPTGDNFLDMASFDHATAPPAQLEVTYTTGGPPALVLTPRLEFIYARKSDPNRSGI